MKFCIIPYLTMTVCSKKASSAASLLPLGAASLAEVAAAYEHSQAVFAAAAAAAVAADGPLSSERGGELAAGEPGMELLRALAAAPLADARRGAAEAMAAIAARHAHALPAEGVRALAAVAATRPPRGGAGDAAAAAATALDALGHLVEAGGHTTALNAGVAEALAAALRRRCGRALLKPGVRLAQALASSEGGARAAEVRA